MAWITHKVFLSIAEVPHNDLKGEAIAFYFCYLSYVKKENADSCLWAQTLNYPSTSAWNPHYWKSWEVTQWHQISSVWPYSPIDTKSTLVSITDSSVEVLFRGSFRGFDTLWAEGEGRHRQGMALAARSPSSLCPKIQPWASQDISCGLASATFVIIVVIFLGSCVFCRNI